MTTAADLKSSVSLPVIVAPMFLFSNPELALAACAEGFVGSFPDINAARVTGGFEAWLQTMEQGLADLKANNPGQVIAPYAVNLMLHREKNPFLDADLALCVKHKVPVVLTSLGDPAEVVKQVHAYGGIVLHDVTNARHAQKAAAAGVDGIIAVTEDAGGHAGTLKASELVAEIRSFYNGLLAVAGGISTGADILAVQQMGADFAYMGTRFLATQESGAPHEYKDALIRASSTDLVYTNAVSGIPGNFLRSSLEKAGLTADDIDHLGPQTGKLPNFKNDAAGWRHIWSAGHGVDNITDIPRVEDLAARLKAEYAAAQSKPAAPFENKKKPKPSAPTT